MLDWSTSPAANFGATVFRRPDPGTGTDCPAGGTNMASLTAAGYTQIGTTMFGTSSVSTYIDRGRTPTTRYCYIVATLGSTFPSMPEDVTTLTDPAPVVTITAPTGGTITVDEGATVNLAATATDVAADGTTPFTALTYAWTQTASASVTTAATTNVVTLSGPNTASTNFVAPEFDADNSTAMLYFLVTVTGSGGGTGTARVTVTVNGDNDEPTVTAAISTALARPGEAITLTANANDDDHSNADITYAWACPAMVNAGATLSAPTITPARSDGTAATTAHTDNAMATFTAPMLEDTAMPPNTAAMIMVTCTVTVVSGGDTIMAVAETLEIANPTGGEAVDNAVLPHVLRNITNGIHGGIYQRIQQRQRADGKWK